MIFFFMNNQFLHWKVVNVNVFPHTVLHDFYIKRARKSCFFSFLTPSSVSQYVGQELKHFLKYIFMFKAKEIFKLKLGKAHSSPKCLSLVNEKA